MALEKTFTFVASANKTTEAMPIQAEYKGAIQIVSDAAVDATDATITLQTSNNNQNWVDLNLDSSGTTTETIDAASSSWMINLHSVVGNWIRVVYSFGTNTAGNITLIVKLH